MKITIVEIKNSYIKLNFIINALLLNQKPLKEFHLKI